MCNVSLKQGALPVSHRHAVVIPRLKKAKSYPSDGKEHRPVSNLTFISKDVERLLCWQLVSFLEKHSLIASFQAFSLLTGKDIRPRWLSLK
jgi:hypothetical protein